MSHRRCRRADTAHLEFDELPRSATRSNPSCVSVRVYLEASSVFVFLPAYSRSPLPRGRPYLEDSSRVYAVPSLIRGSPQLHLQHALASVDRASVIDDGSCREGCCRRSSRQDLTSSPSAAFGVDMSRVHTHVSPTACFSRVARKELDTRVVESSADASRRLDHLNRNSHRLLE